MPAKILLLLTVLLLTPFTVPNASAAGFLSRGATYAYIESLLQRGDYDLAVEEFAKLRRGLLGKTSYSENKTFGYVVRHLKALDRESEILQAEEGSALVFYGNNDHKAKIGGVDIDLHKTRKMFPQNHPGFSKAFFTHLRGRWAENRQRFSQLRGTEEERKQAAANTELEQNRQLDQRARDAGYAGFQTLEIRYMILRARMNGGIRRYINWVMPGGGYRTTVVLQVLPDKLIYSADMGNGRPLTFMVHRETGDMPIPGQALADGLYSLQGTFTYTTQLGGSKTVPVFKRVRLGGVEV